MMPPMSFPLWLLAGLLAAAEPAPRNAEPIERVSELLQTGLEAWAEPGFRLALRFGYESAGGLSDLAPAAGQGFVFAIHPRVRLSPHWSAGAMLQYTLINYGSTGVRFVTGLTVGWHPWRGLEVELGGAYAGQLVEGCDGSGGSGQLRVGYLIAVGELFATGPVLQGEIMGTKCGVSKVWAQRQLQASWAFAWR